MGGLKNTQREQKCGSWVDESLILRVMESHGDGAWGGCRAGLSGTAAPSVRAGSSSASVLPCLPVPVALCPGQGGGWEKMASPCPRFTTHCTSPPN